MNILSILTRAVGLLWVDSGRACITVLCFHHCREPNCLLGIVSHPAKTTSSLGLLQREERTAVAWKWQGLASVSGIVTGPPALTRPWGKGCAPRGALSTAGPPCSALMFWILVQASEVCLCSESGNIENKIWCSGHHISVKYLFSKCLGDILAALWHWIWIWSSWYD